MKNHNPTVTVAVSVFNEEKNITPFLRSVLNQKEEGYILKKIVIHSDGSDDGTVKKIKNLNIKKIILFEHSRREGKSKRLNEIYQELNTDFLVQSDSDVIFANNRVISNMIKPLISDKKIGMCGGSPIPIPAKTFTEQAINYTTDAYNIFRHTVREGNNIFSADGRILSFRKQVVKKIKVPLNMIANDAFAYLCTIAMGYKYRFVEDAVVYYRSPIFLKDHIKQNTRFVASPIRMKKYFKNDFVTREWHIPGMLLIRETFKQFLKHPIHCLYIFGINRYCKIKAKNEEKELSAIWKIAKSTKYLAL